MITKPYLLICSEQVGYQHQVTEALDRMFNVKLWRYDINNVYYIISDSDAQQLSNEFHSLLPNGRFMFAEVNLSNMQGMMSMETWDFLNNNVSRNNGVNSYL